jgi:hypothetical protein
MGASSRRDEEAQLKFGFRIEGPDASSAVMGPFSKRVSNAPLWLWPTTIRRTFKTTIGPDRLKSSCFVRIFIRQRSAIKWIDAVDEGPMLAYQYHRFAIGQRGLVRDARR